MPDSLHTDNYTAAWKVMDLAKLLFNTLYYAFDALACQLVLDVAAAYSLSKLRPVFGKAVLGMMLATLMIPATVSSCRSTQGLGHAAHPAGPVQLALGDLAAVRHQRLRFFDSIPREILAAAATDGAGALRSVVLPKPRPVLGVVSIFAIVGVWKDFLWPMLTLPDPALQTLHVGVYSLARGVPENHLVAALAMACAPTLVILLIFQRNIMSGPTAGSLKG
ncbi:carbohydrate ABC transporter permease [Streptomyces sp. NPDC060031]|uniref:carbohydrate ABC transporter permease n=1 Tax=Streptomyces sp. NPDC060031 TaxID=3347043 RepID=UPI003694F2CF